MSEAVTIELLDIIKTFVLLSTGSLITLIGQRITDERRFKREESVHKRNQLKSIIVSVSKIAEEWDIIGEPGINLCLIDIRERGRFYFQYPKITQLIRDFSNAVEINRKGFDTAEEATTEKGRLYETCRKLIKECKKEMKRYK